MAHRELILALFITTAATPVSASRPEPVPPTAPAGGPETRYCLRVEPHTGSRIETVECWTREQWAAAEVDVDEEWPKEGVRVIEG
jgi:hypothetical protein